MSESNRWEADFERIYNAGVAAWEAGRRTPQTMFSDADATWLATIGYTRRELFDFIDDYLQDGEPDYSTALEVARIRRDHFLNVLQGKPAARPRPMIELPPKSAEIDGIPWLPRIIQKAQWKLAGEMPDDLMFGCGGDRAFLWRVGMTAPQFLTLVRNSGDNESAIVSEVKRCASKLA